MTKKFSAYFGICFFFLAFPSIMFAQTPDWHSDGLIENNTGFNGFSPQVAMSGNNVVAVWYQLDGNGNYRIYSNYSTDGGPTWGTAQLIENNAGFDGAFPQVAISGNNVVAVWQQLDTNGNYRIYSNRSANGGVTWNASAVLIDDHLGFSGGDPQVAMSGLNVVVVWDQEDATTRQRIYSDYSTDGGATWHGDRLLEDNTGFDGWFPQLAMSGNNVVAIWYQPDADFFRIYSNYSNDGGVTWHSDQAINTGDGYIPEVAMSGNNVVAVWARLLDGIFRIYSNYSSDGGANWHTDQPVEDNSGVPIGANQPEVAISGLNVVAAWQQYDGTTSRIYSNYSSDGGASWHADQPIENNTGHSGGFPQVAITELNVVAIWHQSDGSDYRIYSNYSNDGGATWGSDWLIEDNMGYGADSPQLAISGTNMVAVWRQADDQQTLRIYSNHGIFGEAVKGRAVNPKEGTIGTEITISGSEFGTKKGKVLIGTVAPKILQWTDSFIRCQLTKTLSPGIYDVTVQPKEPKGAPAVVYEDEFVVKAPEIQSVEPISSSAGDQIKIEGLFFGTKKGKVTLGGKSCKVLKWEMDPATGQSEIRFVVPKGLSEETNELIVTTTKVGSDAVNLSDSESE